MDELKRLVECGQFAEAIRHFEARLALDQWSPSDLAHGYHVASVAHFRSRDLVQAQLYGEKAAQLAGEAGNVQLQLLAWGNLIEYARHLGDYALAVAYGEQWFANLHRCPREQVKQGRVRYNLGLVHRHRQNPEEALRQFRLALDSEAPSEFRLIVLLMTAWLCYEVRRTSEGDHFAAEAAALLQTRTMPTHLHREHLLLQAWRAYHVGAHQKCMPLCENFLQGEATEQQRFWAATMMASCALQLYPTDPQRVEELKRVAVRYTNLCSELALSIKEPRLISLCTSLRQAVNARWSDDLAV